MSAESWSRAGTDRAVVVHFTTGTPECFGVYATVTETADSVSVELRGGTLPEAGTRSIMIAVSGTLESAASTARRPTGRQRRTDLDKLQ